MPRLDIYREQVAARNELRVVRNARPDVDAMQAPGRALTAVGEVATRITEAKAVQEASNLEIEARRRMDALYREIEQDGTADYEQFEARLLEGSTKVRQELLGKTRFRSVRDKFDLRLQDIETGYLIKTRDLVRQRGVEDIHAGLIGHMASLEETATDGIVPFFDPDNPEIRSVRSEAEAVRAEIRQLKERGFIGADDVALYDAKIEALERGADSVWVMKEIDARLEAGEMASAEEFFKLNYGRILPAQREAAEQSIEQKSLQVGAVRRADEIWSGSGGDFMSAMSEAAQIENVDERLAVESRLVRMRELDTAARRESEDAAAEQGWTVLSGGGGVQDIPASVWAATSGRDRIAMQDWAKRQIGVATGQVKSFYGKETFPIIYTDVRDRLDQGDTVGARRILMASPGQFRESDWKSLYAETGKPPKGADELPGAKGDLAPVTMLDAVAERAGITNKSQRAELRLEYDRAVQQFSAANGKEPDDAWKTKKAEELALPIKLRRPGVYNDESGPRAALIDDLIEETSIPPEYAAAVLLAFPEDASIGFKRVDELYTEALGLFEARGIEPEPEELSAMISSLYGASE